jgi:hypothetical protein
VTAILLATAVASAQPLVFDATRVPIGKVFHYLKSNIDGTRLSRIHVYVRTADTIESFKADKGDEVGTLVVATMNWSRFSVRRFESTQVSATGGRTVRATLVQQGDSDDYLLTMGEMSLPARVGLWPWHSYDFDFASLGLTLSHRTSPEATFTFGRSDFVQGEGPPRFADLGAITMTYEADETREGVGCRRYRLDGPGLEGKGGTLWAARDGGHIVEFQIAIPDEPGFTSGRLRLESVEAMSVAQWAAFIRDTLTP